jgi:hypothetical protein
MPNAAVVFKDSDMGVVSRVLTVVADRVWRRFEASGADPETAQARVLSDLVRQAAATEWGREVGLAEVRTPEDFRRRVPVSSYEAASPLWHRAFDGARDVTWPGHVRYFAASSGTTAGNKLIPVTRDAIRSNRRAGTILAAVLSRRGGAEALAGGKFLYLGGCTNLKARGQSLCGDASGIMARHIPFYARGRRLPSPEIGAIEDWEERIARIVGSSLDADVRAMGACPSWAAILFKELRREAESRGRGSTPVGRLWPNFSHFVSYGMAFEPYRSAFEEYIGRPVDYIDTYSSSEGGMTAIQDEPGGPMRLVVDNGVFFEFIPADVAQPPSAVATPEGGRATRLALGEVETGRDYSMVLSTNGGIWAYPLGDVVRFVSLRPPRIAFVGRTQIDLSAFGEHVTMEMIETAMAAACHKTGAVVADYTVAPRFPSPDHSRPAHRWLVEFDRPPADADVFMAAIDSSIRAACEDYEAHRRGDYGLEPPILVPVPQGTFYAWMKSRGRLGGQNKVPRVVRSAEMAEELLAIAKAKQL